MQIHPFRSPLHVALVLVWLLPGATRAQMFIDEVSLTSGPFYRGGAFVTYFIYPYVLGEGIASVTLSSANGQFSELSLDEVTPDEFICDEEIMSPPCQDFASLAEISALGTLTLDFVGEFGEIDSVSLNLNDYDPGAGQVGFAGIVSPAYLETNVPTNATIDWTMPPSWVDVVDVGLEELVSGIFTDEAVFLGAPVMNTSWTPSGLANGTAYYLGISFFDVIVFPEIRVTNGARGFEFVSAFEAFNESTFTVPEPDFAISLGSSLVLLAGLARRRRNAWEAR